ncbi:hypothetical protein JHK85_052140 [Glycine max]|nr:hypothetical protein JHK85_052140 [Glycine max]
MYLCYVFTNLLVIVILDLTGQDYNDFDYNMIKDMHVVSCFIKEWGDIVIMLKNDTKVDLRSFPKFREIAKYCLAMAQKPFILIETRPKAF